MPAQRLPGASNAVESLTRLVRFHANSANLIFTTSDAVGAERVSADESLVSAILQAAVASGAIAVVEPGVYEALDADVLEDDGSFVGTVNAIILRKHATVPLLSASAPDPDPAAGKLLTEAQAAKLAGISQKTIRRLIKSGRLPAKDYGSGSKHLYRIAPDDLHLIESTEPARANGTAPTSQPRQRSRRRSASPAGPVGRFPRVEGVAKGIVKRPLTRG
jgi:excisionase family DNA binding protein